MNYLIGDALIRIKNAIMAGQKKTFVPRSKAVESIMKVLKKDDKIFDYEVLEDMIEVKLLFSEEGESVIQDIVIVSKPGQRIYKGYKELWPVMNGRGTGVISTSRGIMTVAGAKKLKLGGEYICKVL